jgi:uncharacterized protein DUF3592
MKNLAILKIAAFVMLTVSMLLIAVGVYEYFDKNKFLGSCKVIKCKVVNMDEPVRGQPIYQFTDLSGTYRDFYIAESYDTDDGEPDYKVNETYEVYYYPKDTGRSEVKDFMNNYETAFIFFIIGIVFMIDFPVLLFVVNLQKKKLKKSREEAYGFKENVISE